MMDKYDELLESARDFEAEDYMSTYYPDKGKEEEVAECWEMHKQEKELAKFGSRL